MYPTEKKKKTPHLACQNPIHFWCSIKSSFFKIESLVSLSNSLSDFSEFLVNIQIFFNTYYELGIIPCAEGTWSSESLAWQVDSLPLSQLGCPHYIAAAAAKSLQSCPTLCNPIDGSPPGSTTIPGILQARTLEWVAISFSNAASKQFGASQVAQW